MRRGLDTYFLLCLIISVLCSCTEIITLDFMDAGDQLVVEARVPELDYAKVRITKSVEIRDSVIFPTIDDAEVLISDNEGNSEILKLTTPGLYESKILRGIPGRKYNLKIKNKDYEISATDSLPQPVRISKLVVRKFQFEDPGLGVISDSTGIMMEVAVHFTDPVNQKNNYRFIEYLNGNVINTYLTDDKFNNGKLIHMFLINLKRRFNPGDTVSVEMQTITDDVYKCFNNNSMSGGGTVFGSPANPLTNLTGAKLGYFSAYGSHTRKVILTPDYFD